MSTVIKRIYDDDDDDDDDVKNLHLTMCHRTFDSHKCTCLFVVRFKQGARMRRTDRQTTERQTTLRRNV